MHILSTTDLPKDKIDHWFDLAKQISENPQKWSKSLEGKIAGTLFFEPSTRTRWSTEAAMIRLGGNVLSMECAKESSSDKKGESLIDTIDTCSKYVDCLIIRHPQENIIKKVADNSDVPVINAGDGSNEHPTQALLDLYTILQHFPDPTGKSIMFTGDISCSRTIHSLLKLLEPYNMRVIVEGAHNVKYSSCWYVYRDEPYARLPEIDILYMTRHQKERVSGLACPNTGKIDWGKEREPSQFVMTHALACTMKKEAIIMHPLPRNNELLSEVDKNPRAIYFTEQIPNGMWVRMAILLDLIK